MKAHLMYRDRDFDLKSPKPHQSTELIQDLELGVLFGAMAESDKFLLEAAQVVILSSLEDTDAILYRQRILEDCLRHPDVVRAMYGVSVAAVEGSRKVWRGTLNRYPDRVLYWSTELLRTFMVHLKRLRDMANKNAAAFESEGFGTLLRTLAKELDDDYLTSIERHLQYLGFRDGVLMSAELGAGNKGTRYILRVPPAVTPTWVERLRSWVPLLSEKGPAQCVYELDPRDESGANALAELKNRGVATVASVLGESADHVQSFFEMLRAELAFYIGCLNLRDRLQRHGEPICLPEAVHSASPTLSSRGLYDVALSLTSVQKVVGNDISAEGKSLVIVTGANRGGKSTALRSIGQAQLMMQCGMFVTGVAFRANVCAGIFTHFKRDEDSSMKSGKFDEELARMSAIVDRLKPNCLMLFNESFASTNAREGSEIAAQIVSGLLEADIKVVYVTHLFDLAHKFYASAIDKALFLRAERLPDGRRTFRLIEGAPLPTSYGEDLYRKIFVATPSDEAIRAARAPV